MPEGETDYVDSVADGIVEKWCERESVEHADCGLLPQPGRGCGDMATEASGTMETSAGSSPSLETLGELSGGIKRGRGWDQGRAGEIFFK